uniref:Uncharacterized protein n=1 Tax=Rhizophora mucronata TaxID=61149 RepID=A0A2P2QKJ3_RHIMU
MQKSSFLGSSIMVYNLAPSNYTSLGRCQ